MASVLKTSIESNGGKVGSSVLDNLTYASVFTNEYFSAGELVIPTKVEDNLFEDPVKDPVTGEIRLDSHQKEIYVRGFIAKQNGVEVKVPLNSFNKSVTMYDRATMRPKTSIDGNLMKDSSGGEVCELYKTKCSVNTVDGFKDFFKSIAGKTLTVVIRRPDVLSFDRKSVTTTPIYKIDFKK